MVAGFSETERRDGLDAGLHEVGRVDREPVGDQLLGALRDERGDIDLNKRQVPHRLLKRTGATEHSWNGDKDLMD